MKEWGCRYFRDLLRGAICKDGLLLAREAPALMEQIKERIFGDDQDPLPLLDQKVADPAICVLTKRTYVL